MPSANLEKLDRALGQIDRPGTFCVSGSVPAVLPGLEVEGLGPVGLPLTARTAKDLIKHCHQAPYGKGEKTLVDTNVRRVWRMEPDRFALTNPDWDRVIKEIVARVQEELGLESQKLESHLYDLLLYEPGSFFLPHRDGEKLDRMVATLVVVLPSSYEGGELIVRHDGQERTIDFGGPSGDPFHIHYAAFYADCEHEVRPLEKGHRLCLVYNLTLAKSKKSLSAPRDSEHIETDRSAHPELGRRRGVDREAGHHAGPSVHPGRPGLGRAQGRGPRQGPRPRRGGTAGGLQGVPGAPDPPRIGIGEDDGGYGYGRGRRYNVDDDEDEDDDDGGDYKMGEIYETSLTAEHWSDPEGNRVCRSAS